MKKGRSRARTCAGALWQPTMPIRHCGHDYGRDTPDRTRKLQVLCALERARARDDGRFSEREREKRQVDTSKQRLRQQSKEADREVGDDDDGASAKRSGGGQEIRKKGSRAAGMQGRTKQDTRRHW